MSRFLCWPEWDRWLSFRCLIWIVGAYNSDVGTYIWIVGQKYLIFLFFKIEYHYSYLIKKIRCLTWIVGAYRTYGDDVLELVAVGPLPYGLHCGIPARKLERSIEEFQEKLDQPFRVLLGLRASARRRSRIAVGSYLHEIERVRGDILGPTAVPQTHVVTLDGECKGELTASVVLDRLRHVPQQFLQILSRRKLRLARDNKELAHVVDICSPVLQLVFASRPYIYPMGLRARRALRLLLLPFAEGGGLMYRFVIWYQWIRGLEWVGEEGEERKAGGKCRYTNGLDTTVLLGFFNIT